MRNGLAWTTPLATRTVSTSSRSPGKARGTSTVRPSACPRASPPYTSFCGENSNDTNDPLAEDLRTSRCGKSQPALHIEQTQSRKVVMFKKALLDELSF